MGSEAVFRAQAAIVRDAIGQLNVDESLEQRARHLLESIDPAQIDATLERTSIATLPSIPYPVNDFSRGGCFAAHARAPQ